MKIFNKKYYIRYITFIIAFCSIVYELLLANTLAIITDNQIFWHSVTIGFYILGLGIGALHSEKRLNRESFIQIELNLSLLGFLSASFIYVVYGMYNLNEFLQFFYHGFYTPNFVHATMISSVIFFVLSQSITFLIGYFSGFEVPLCTHLDEEENGDGNENVILAINYVGTLCGTLVFSYFLYTKLDILYTSYLIASINFSIVLFLVFPQIKKISLKSYLKSSIFVAMAIFLVGQNHWIEQFYLKTTHVSDQYLSTNKMDVYKFLKNVLEIKDIERVKTKYQYIDKYSLKVPDQEKEATVVAINTHFQFSTHNERFYHESMAHVSINILDKKPKKILVLGGGDGLLLRELLKYKDADITHIELDPMMIEFSQKQKWLKELNESSLDNKKVKRLLGDGFYFLRNTKEKFDLIFVDFPYPTNYNLAKLYSFEFYSYVRKSLNPLGAAVIDGPVIRKHNYLKHRYLNRPTLSHEFTDDDYRHNSIMLSTVNAAGFSNVFPYQVNRESFIILTGKENILNLDFENHDRKFISKILLKDMIEIRDQEFPHIIDRKMVNSIFKPNLLTGIF